MLKSKPHPLGRYLRHPLFKSSAFLGAVSAFLPGGSILAYSHFIETRRLEIVRMRVPIRGLTAPVRLMHISDAHLIRHDRWHLAMFKKIAELSCDLLVMTGDLVLPGFDLANVRAMLRLLPNAPLGRYMVPGNWEYWAGLQGDMLRALASDTGFHLLLNTFHELPRRLVIGGTDSELGGTPDVEGLLSGLPSDRPAIILTHCPSTFRLLDTPPVQLVLAGHTHGGQIRLPPFGALWLPTGTGKYDMGWFQGRYARLYVNRGFGTSLARLRLFCRPEVSIFELHPAH